MPGGAPHSARAEAPTARGRTDTPFVDIRIIKEVIASDPEGNKAGIAVKMTVAIWEATGLSDEVVWVVFEEVNAPDWYLGPTDVETRRRG